MFSRNTEVNRARRTLVQTARKPEAGTIIRGLRGLPIRIHLQMARGSETEIFAYATLVPLNADLTATKQQWYLRDFAARELAGTKVILSQKSREKLLRTFDGDDVFGECDVLPVLSLKVARVAASGKSLEAEIAEFVPADMLEYCKHFALAAMECAGDDSECLDRVQEDFYHVIEEEYGEEGVRSPSEAVSEPESGGTARIC